MGRMVRAWLVPVAALALAASGCKGSKGADGLGGASGRDGTDATAYGTLSGTIVDTYGNVVAGATASALVGEETVSATADASGAYALALPPGERTVSFAATGYNAFQQTIEALPAETITLDVVLNPTGKAAVTARRTDTATPVVPGLQIGLAATLLVFDPALLPSTATYKWTVVSGPPATFDDDTSPTPKATLASRADFKKGLVELATPTFGLGPEEPLVSVDRYQVVALSYEQAMSLGSTTKFQVAVTLDGKTYRGTVSVAAKIPAVPSSGLASVPIGSPVILQGQFPFKDAFGDYVFGVPTTVWSWSVAGPGGDVALNDPTTPYPDFVPTTAGTYVVSQGGVERLRLYAGTYVGAMQGPGVAKDACTTCHDDAIAPDNFTSWLKTGHKEVIWAGIMEPRPEGHYSKTCTPCHTVGVGQTGAGGFADPMTALSIDFAPLQGDLNAEEDFWVLYPEAATLGGIQCEVCHGPNTARHAAGSAQNGTRGNRVTFSSNVCALCHARAPSHGRFTMWSKSAHARYATFTYNSDVDGALSKSCACCHSAQGFKAFRAALPTANGNRSATVLPAGLTVNNAEPITCAACHAVHDEGDAGKVEWTNLAQVGPAEGETWMLPSGFRAIGVGKGALCIACHNSRQGYSSASSSTLVGPFLHEDGDPRFDTTTITGYGAPHEAAQGDVLLGRNAYWLGAALHGSPQTRSAHSYITDTCVTCHMKRTTLDPLLARPGQTRHDFLATPDVCNQCHVEYSAEAVQAVFSARLDDLKAAVGTAILRLKYDDDVPAGTTAVLVANRSGQVDVTSSGVTRRWFIGTKTGQDAFLTDPNDGGALVQGCTMVTAIEADCTGFLAGAPGVTSIPTSAAQDATVTADGVSRAIAKALWNAVLVQDDASRGVHNPSFELEVMDATIRNVAVFAQ